MSIDIKIMSTTAARNFLVLNQNQWDTICITNPGSLIPPLIQRHSQSYINLIFDDIDCPLDIYVPPMKEDVRQALQFAEDKNRLIVTCPSGQTGCAAIAYVLWCKKWNNPKNAIKELLASRHYPNKLIVKYAAEILDNPEIYNVFDRWVQRPSLLPTLKL